MASHPLSLTHKHALTLSLFLSLSLSLSHTHTLPVPCWHQCEVSWVAREGRLSRHEWLAWEDFARHAFTHSLSLSLSLSLPLSLVHSHAHSRTLTHSLSLSHGRLARNEWLAWEDFARQGLLATTYYSLLLSSLGLSDTQVSDPEPWDWRKGVSPGTTGSPRRTSPGRPYLLIIFFVFVARFSNRSIRRFCEWVIFFVLAVGCHVRRSVSIVTLCRDAPRLGGVSRPA